MSKFTTATVNWNKLADQPVERAFVRFSASGRLAVILDHGREKRVPRNCVQLGNGFYHDRSHVASESCGLPRDYTVVTGLMTGVFGIYRETFTGDTFTEAVEKAKKNGAFDVRVEF